ncbi:MAG: TasA family protein [Marmoricola sp.]
MRAALATGGVGLLVTTSTYAYWTDDAAITGTTFSTGVLDLQVDGANAYATTTLGMSGMVPGATSAEVLTLKNNGTVALTYTLVGGLTGTDAVALGPALTLTITTGTRVVSGSNATCSGGTSVAGPQLLTAVTTTAIIGTRRGPLSAGATENLCFQVTFDAAAASTLQGKTAQATFTATGTSDLS